MWEEFELRKVIFSLLKILKEIKLDFTITIINPEKFYDKKLENDKVKIVHFKKDHLTNYGNI